MQRLTHTAKNIRTLFVRPCKTPAGKARTSKAQRARLVKLGMDAEKVKLMGDEDVRVLVQRPAVVKKLVAKAAK